MSDEKPKPNAFWNAWLPQPDMQAIRDVAAKSFLPINYNNIDDDGICHIHVPVTLRAPNDLRVSKWFAHIYDREHRGFDFDPAWKARNNEPSPMLSFWLRGDAFPTTMKRDEIDAQLQNFAHQLGVKHDIPDLRALYCVPPRAQTEHFLQETAGAVVLYAHPRNAHKLPEVKKTIERERHNELNKPKPGYQFLIHARTWEERFGAHKEVMGKRDKLALQEVMRDQHELLGIRPIHVEESGNILLHLDRNAHMLLDHRAQAPMDFYFDPPEINVLEKCKNTNGLAVMLKPDFFDQGDFGGDDGLDSRFTPEQREQRYFEASVQPRIEAFTDALSRRCGIPIEVAFCRLRNHDFPDCEAIAPNVLLLMTTPEHQRTLATMGRSELQKQCNAALRSEDEERRMRRGGDGRSGR